MQINRLFLACRVVPLAAVAAMFSWLLAGTGCTTRSDSPKATARATRTYTNPVYAGSMPDPSVIRYGGFYYAFGTTGSERTPDGRIFTLLRSRNLVDWENLGGALTPPSPNPRVQYWAPEATVSDGKFYLYYAMGGIKPEKFELHVAVSARPEGPSTPTAARSSRTARTTTSPLTLSHSAG